MFTSVRKPFVSNRLVWPEDSATRTHATEPPATTANPQPVTRGPKLAAVIMAAIIVAAGAIHPESSFMKTSTVQRRVRGRRPRSVKGTSPLGVENPGEADVPDRDRTSLAEANGP